MMSSRIPNLADLATELERRLLGDNAGGMLTADLAIPDARTYVLVLFDGLGDDQVGTPEAAALSSSRIGKIHSPFPSTTAVSLSSVATALDPLAHGVVGYLLWLGDTVVNTLKWVDLTGQQVSYPTEGLLPAHNLWERLSVSGLEGITVQPAGFETTPLTAALYRGARFEGVTGIEDTIETTCTLAREPGRLIFAYFPQVDYAGHVFGVASSQFREALRLVSGAWDELRRRLPRGAVMVGTADHGMIDYPDSGKLLVRDPEFDELVFYGDSRTVYVRGDLGLVRELASRTGAQMVDSDRLETMWGDGARHPAIDERKPDAALLAARGTVILPSGFDKRLIGYHGGAEPEEIEIPLLVETGR